MGFSDIGVRVVIDPVGSIRSSPSIVWCIWKGGEWDRKMC